MGLNLPLPIPAVYYKSRGLGRAKPWPSRSHDPRLGLEFQKAGAALGRAKAAAFRPSRAGTALHLPCFCIPDTDCVITRARDNMLPIRGVCHRPDIIIVPFQRPCNHLPHFCIPDADCLVTRPRDNMLSIKGVCHRLDRITVSFQRACNHLPHFCMPDTDCVVTRARDNMFTIRRVCHR